MLDSYPGHYHATRSLVVKIDPGRDRYGRYNCRRAIEFAGERRIDTVLCRMRSGE